MVQKLLKGPSISSCVLMLSNKIKMSNRCNQRHNLKTKILDQILGLLCFSFSKKSLKCSIKLVYFQSPFEQSVKLSTASKLMKLKIAPLSKLHDHLADGLPVVCLLMGLVHRHTHRPGAWKAGRGQASSWQRNAVRVVRREKSAKRCVGDSWIMKWFNRLTDHIILTFGRITDIVTAAIYFSVLLSCVTVLVVTFSVEGEKIHTDIPKTVSSVWD